MNEISIKVNIADRTYPLTIMAEQEEQVRKAVKSINDKVKSLQQTFAVKDKQDILSMIALETAVALMACEANTHQQHEQLHSKASSIATLLSHISI